MRIKANGYIYLAISLLIGALLPVVLDLATNINIFEFLALSFLVTIPFSYLLLLRSKQKARLASYLGDKKSLFLIVIIGLLSYIPSEFILSYSEHFVTASLATAVYRTWPLLMLFALPYLLRERLSKYQVIALLLAFLGIYIALTSGTFELAVSDTALPIIMLLTFGAFCYGLGGMLMKKYVFNVEASIFLFSVSLFLLFALLFLLTGARSSLFNVGDIIAILYLGLAVNIIGYYGYFATIRILKTTFATNAYLLSPFLTFVFASIVLGETIKVYYLLIAVLVSAGLLIQEFDKIGGTYANRKSKIGNSTIFDITGVFASEKDHEVINVIEKGEKILAIKIHSRYHDRVKEMLKEKNYGQVYTDFTGFRKEIGEFVSEIVGRKEDELVIIRAGSPEESEGFFDELKERLS